MDWPISNTSLHHEWKEKAVRVLRDVKRGFRLWLHFPHYQDSKLFLPPSAACCLHLTTSFLHCIDTAACVALGKL